MTNELDIVRDDEGKELTGAYKHMRVLDRRLEFLIRRINRAEREGRVLTHDIHEADALQWAITTIYDWVELPEAHDECLRNDEQG